MGLVQHQAVCAGGALMNAQNVAISLADRWKGNGLGSESKLDCRVAPSKTGATVTLMPSHGETV
jgi:hypothetical protein